RRVHPLGAGNLMREIGEERRILGPLRARAHLVLDTSELSPRALKEALVRFLLLPRLAARVEEVRKALREAEVRGDGEAVRRLSLEFQRLCRQRLELLRKR
ncbi:MAG: RNase adapter RapZ, partial [Candidatus Bipolaricaulaceae bacterium]